MDTGLSCITLALSGLVSAAVAIAATGPAPAAARLSIELPAHLTPADARPHARLRARGVQIYRCARTGGADAQSAPRWLFVAPRAELLDEAGRIAGSHGAGPYWQATDGSRVEGQVVARHEAPVSGAIPWLLLHTHATALPGQMSPVTRIARIHTHGGLPPDQGCDAASDGRWIEVPYTADYLLFVAAGH